MQGVIVILICILKAFICALITFLISLFIRLKHFKHILFFILAFSYAVAVNIKHFNFPFETLCWYIFMDIIGTYFGLIFLIALRNMSGCRICDKIRARFGRTS